jgi:peroxiredoxin
MRLSTLFRRPLTLSLAAALAMTGVALAPASPAAATLAQGQRAPHFTAQGAQGGRRMTVSLRNALRRGPVVIYFFPRAFTSGCTIESRAFAEAMPQFRAAGATVIGMSGDDVDTLARFSTEECRSAFPMASASAEVISGFDVSLRPGMTSRTSYVIARDGTVAMVHNDMNPNDHVRETLAAVQRLQAAARPRRR